VARRGKGTGDDDDDETDDDDEEGGGGGGGGRAYAWFGDEFRRARRLADAAAARRHLEAAVSELREVR
jgi:hypothetical protein